MTVSTSANRADYNGNGTTTSFAVPFYFPDPSNLQVLSTVIATGISATLVLNSDYTVAGAGVSTGGTVTMTVAPASTVKLSILLSLLPIQQTHWVENDPMHAAVIEAAVDYLTLLAKQEAEQISRAISVPIGESGSSAVLPAAAARANNFLAFDSLGNPTIGVPAAGSAASVLTQLANVLLAAQGAGSVGFNPTLNYATGTIGKHAGVEWNPQDYPWLAKFDGVTDDTAAINACLAAVIAAGGGAMVLPQGNAKCSGITTGNINATRINFGLIIRGCGKNRTSITQTGTNANGLFYIAGTTPGSGVPTSLQLVLKDFSLKGSGFTDFGLVLDGIASFNIDGITCEGFSRGLYIHSSLIGTVKHSGFQGNTSGIVLALNGTAAYNNNITFEKCIVGGNSKYGWDIGSANGIQIRECDIESNGVVAPTSTVTMAGTVITWPSHGLSVNEPVIFSSTGTLPSNVIAREIYYAVPIDANTFNFSSSLGGSFLNVGTGGSGTYTGISPNSGAIVIRNTCINEAGLSSIAIRDNWFEGNYGAGVRTEYQASALGTKLTIEGCHILGATPGTISLAIGAIAFLSVRDVWAVSGADVAYINASNFICEDSYFITLYKPGMALAQSGGNGFTHVRNSWWNGFHHIDGEVQNYTGTGTGFASATTFNFGATIQGNHVRLVVPAVTNTSNATTFTITGMPTILIPRSSVGQYGGVNDNGVTAMSRINIDNTGLMAFNYGMSGGFTASGSKGVGATFSIEYDI